MRCESCQKFVSNEDADPEPESVDDTEGGNPPTVDVRRVRVCAECGSEMKEATLTVEANEPAFTVADEYRKAVDEHEAEVPGDLPYDPEHCPARVPEDGALDDAPACQFEWDDVWAENTDRSEGRGRGTKTFYGVQVTFHGTCSHCGSTASADGSDEVRAGSMDELM